VLWRDALDWCLGVLQNLYPLVEAGERDGVFSKAVDDTIYRRLRDKWQYDFSGLDHGEHVRFASEFLAEACDRFGLVPFTELLAGNDPREALQAHGKQGEPATGENLVLAALMLDLPAFVSAVKRGGAS
jgi:hypothetical protein